jgi:C-terminal processing protease CtpA/Prc
MNLTGRLTLVGARGFWNRSAFPLLGGLLMLRRNVALLVALAVVAAVPAFAGEYGKKCDKGTQECLNMMAESYKKTAWIGVELDDDAYADGTWKLTKVVPDSPAEAAGLEPGDVVVAMNGVKISHDNKAAFHKVRKSLKPGSQVTTTIKRNGYDREVKFTLSAMPADMLAKQIGKHMMDHAEAEVAAK